MKRIVVREHDLHIIGDTRTFRTLYVIRTRRGGTPTFSLRIRTQYRTGPRAPSLFWFKKRTEPFAPSLIRRKTHYVLLADFCISIPKMISPIFKNKISIYIQPRAVAVNKPQDRRDSKFPDSLALSCLVTIPSHFG